MTAYPLQPILPWSGLREEDRRFRLILAAVLTVFFLLSTVVPHLPVPEIDTPWEAELSPRLVRIIDDSAEIAAALPASGQQTAQTAVATPGPEPQPALEPVPEPDSVASAEGSIADSRIEPEASVAPPESDVVSAEETIVAASPAVSAPVSTPEPDQAAIEAAAREKAASTGLLALSDSLAQLQGTAPKIAAAEPVLSSGTGGAQAIVRRPSVLTEDISKGSGGSTGDIVAHQKVLGTATLQPREGTGSREPVGRGGAVAAAREPTGSSRGGVRSEDEIQKVLDRNKRAIYMIYNRELTRDPKLKGKVVVSITIAPSGKVTACKVVYSELNAAPMERKLVSLIKRIDFGAKPGIPVVTTRVPIEFFPV